MIDLTKCEVERLGADETFILYRAYKREGEDSFLALVARQPSIHCFHKLKNSHALAVDLGAACAVLPIELVPHKDSMMLVHHDPGGCLLAEMVGKAIDLDARLRIAVSLSKTIGRLHRHGWIHRDIRPTNILITPGYDARLIGLGYAVHQTQQEASLGYIAGALPYIAPEQTGRFNRRVDCRSDLYSLGVTLYEFLTAALPFFASSPEEWIHCHLARSPFPPTERANDLPAPISRILLKLLSKEPADRYQSADGLAADLEECLLQWRVDRQVRDFDLGRYDSVAAIQIPRKLYGRALQSDTLDKAFLRVRESGQTAVAMIAGPSGVGKSALVREFQVGLRFEDALMAAGKFHVQMQDIPYAALAQIFRSLIRQILTYDEATVASWRKALIEAVGLNGRLVIELLPSFELLIGGDYPPVELTPGDRLNRIRIVFRRLVQTFANPRRPLVLFFDDLQWIDAATLDLIGDLITRRDVSNLLLVGAYRTNEIDILAPLISQLNALRSAGVDIEDLDLQPLLPEDIAIMVAETLQCNVVRVRGLANLIHMKTGGNPFFVIQFFKALNEEGYLKFDRSTRVWDWNIARIREKSLTDNIADLTALQVNVLPRGTREMLQVLACLGASATLDMLAISSRRSLHEVSEHLQPALRASLIVRRAKSFAFVHDRIQEAAYEFGPDGKRANLHLQIGLALAAHIASDDGNDKIYITANQLNRGRSAVKYESERKTIVDVNLSAGRYARGAAAYDAALFYLGVASNLLGDQSDPSCSRIAFDLALLRAECEFLVGELDEAERQLLALSESCPDIQTSGDVTRLRANVYTVRGRTESAIDVGLEFLRLVGIDWNSHPTDAEVDREGEHLKELAQTLSDDKLQNLPPLTEPIHLATAAVLADLVTPALLTDLNLSNIVILAATRLTLLHGVCPELCYPVTCSFSVLNIRYSDPELGVRLARFGISLADRWQQSKWSGRAHLAYGHYVIPWIQSSRTGLPLIRRAIEIAFATGELNWASYSHHALASSRLFSGDGLREISKEAGEGVIFSDAWGFRLNASSLATQRDFAIALMEGDRDNSACIPNLSPLADLKSAPPQNLCFHYLARIQLNVIAGRNEAALELAAEVPFKSIRAYPDVIEYRFYTALAHAAVSDTCAPELRDAHIGGLRQHHSEIKNRCSRNRANFAARIALLAAEIARVERRALEAEQHYEEAIQLARDDGFVQIEAVAAERAARFYAARNIRTVSHAYLTDARDCYLRWGAVAKARQLEVENPHLSSPYSISGLPGGSDVPWHQLDINALFRASHALSQEIELDSLIRKLMQVVIEHAAAERGVLFLMRNKVPCAVAEASVSVDGVEVSVKEAGHRDIAYPVSVLNYVVRTRGSLSSGEAENEHILSADSYLQERRQVSLHCLPIITQTKLIGVLYLENHVAVRAFAPQRKAMLGLLAAQAATSLENARLYADLQRNEAFLIEGQSISRTGSWSWNEANRETIWSLEHYRLFGLDPNSARLSLMRRAFRHVYPEDRASVRHCIRSALKNGDAFACEYRLKRSDGVRYMHMVGRPSNENGMPRSYVGTTVDVTEQRRSQENLQAAQADLARASRLTAIGELTSLIAHEVRQPLTAIAARATAAQSWLAYSPPDISRATNAVTLIEDYASRASGIIESIRQMARKSSSRRIPLDINSVIQETVSLLHSEVRRQHVQLTQQLAFGLPAIVGDPIQLQQVVMNLMLNGIEAMAEVAGRPRNLRLITEEGSPGIVRVAVEDVGVGLSASKLENLFEAFSSTKPNGLGVGLAICRSIVDMHGGHLRVKSNEPCGAIFEFTIPAEGDGI